jgi:hypothetical protein
MSRETLNMALIKKAEQVKNAAEFLMSKTRDWQMIKAYLTNRLEEIELSEEQEKKKTRYEFIYNQLVSGKYTDEEVRQMLIKTYKIKNGQSYDDMNCARELFYSVININKRFEINLELQINRNMMRKAEELNDFRAVAQLEKNRAMLLKLLPEEEETPAEHFEGHEIEAVFDPALLGGPAIDMKEVLKAINEKRKVKINTDMFTEIEEVKDGNQTAPLQ